MVMGRVLGRGALWWSWADSVISAHRKAAKGLRAPTPLESATFEVKCRGDGRRILLRPTLDRHAVHLRPALRARAHPDLRPRPGACHGPGAEPGHRAPDRAV